jgi:two-component sensor histidine kinase
MLDVVSNALLQKMTGADAPRAAAAGIDRRDARQEDPSGSIPAVIQTFCHDIRTPLSVVSEFADLLLQDLSQSVSQEHAEFLRIIADRTGEIARMIDDLSETQRAPSASTPLRRSTLSVRAALEEIRPELERRAAERGMPLLVAFDPDVPEVVCDRAILNRVVTTLIDDIARSAGAGGRISVRCSYDADRRNVMIGVLERHDGLQREHLKLDWDRVRQLALETPGVRQLGFRLQMIRDLVERNMGRFWAGFDGGRTFIFTVPEFDLETLIPLQAALLARFQSVPSMSVLRIDAPSGFAAARQDFAAHLADQLRACDLVLPVGEASWLLCVAAAAEDLPCLIARLTASCDHFAAEHQVEPGRVEARIAGSWPLSGDAPWAHRSGAAAATLN